jgi:hypothetical protein
MKKTNMIVSAVISLALLAGSALAAGNAGSVWKAADGEYAFQIKYTPSDSDNVATVQVAAAAITFSGQDVASGTINLTAAYKASDVVSAISALTNTAGTKCFQAMYWASIAADTVSNKLVAASATALTSDLWTKMGAWDTSGVLHYDAATTKHPDYKLSHRITGLMGEPSGTGALTLTVYENGVVKYLRTITSPYYTKPATENMTGTVTNVVNNDVPIDGVSFGTGIEIGAGYVGFVRASRATTATTGGIGASIDE